MQLVLSILLFWPVKVNICRTVSRHHYFRQ